MVTKLIVACVLFGLLVFLAGLLVLVGWLTSQKDGEG